MIKAKAKAERAAARQANQVAGSSTAAVEAATTPATEAEGRFTPSEAQSQEAPVPESDDTTPVPAQSAPLDRVEVLRSNPAVVSRFMQLLVPILVDVYAASVIIAVRVKTLNGLLKASAFLESQEIQQILKVRRIALPTSDQQTHVSASLFQSQLLHPQSFRQETIHLL